MQTAKKKMTASSIYFQSFPYGIHSESNLINYDSLTSQARLFKPKLIICGASAYPRDWDYGKLRAIADEHGASLMADIAHTSGLVAAGELDNPFEFCDVVTTTTYVIEVPSPYRSLIITQSQDPSWTPGWFNFLPEGFPAGTRS
jgi:glycine hydroxymethyltransferase